jgi:hypothetical protein
MPLNKKKFQEFERRLILTLQNKTPLMEVPYYVCLYNPKDELDVIENFSNLALRIKNKGFSSETINLGKMMINILQRSGLLSPEILKNEEHTRDTLEGDIRRTLSKGLIENLKQKLGGKKIDHCAILLRYGALWPFLHLSYIFLNIEGEVQSTIVVPYPSELGIGYPLNEQSKGMPDYYRAEVVDLR